MQPLPLTISNMYVRIIISCKQPRRSQDRSHLFFSSFIFSHYESRTIRVSIYGHSLQKFDEKNNGADQ
jgi:hypothetical protein